MTNLIGVSEKAVEPPSLPPSSLSPSSLPPPPPSNAQRAARTSALPPTSSLPPPLHRAVPPPLPAPAAPAPDRSISPTPLPKAAIRPSAPVSGPPPLPVSPTDVRTRRGETGQERPVDVAKLASQGSVVRVSIKTSVRDPNLVVVRKLEAGQTLPPGRTEAYLVLADPGADPFGAPAPKDKS